MHLGSVVLQISVYSRGSLVAQEHFRERHLVLGRDPTMADVAIGSGKISREHALLEHDGQRVVVHDLRSTNGVFVNGRRVTRAELGPRDRLHVGEHDLRLRLVRPGQEAAAALADPQAEPALPAAVAAAGDFAPQPTAEIVWLPAALQQTSEIQLTPREQAVPVEAPPATFLYPEDTAPAGPPPADEDDFDPDAGFSLLRLVLRDAAAARQAPVATLRVAVTRSRGETITGHTLLDPGGTFRLPRAHVRERWSAALPGRRALRAQHLRRGAANVQLLSDARWERRRGEARADEAAGIREGWARRWRGGVAVSLAPGDVLALHLGRQAYYIRLVAAPAPLAPRHAPTRRLRWPVVAATSLSVLAHGLALGIAVPGGAARQRAPLARPNAPVAYHGSEIAWTPARTGSGGAASLAGSIQTSPSSSTVAAAQPAPDSLAAPGAGVAISSPAAGTGVPPGPLTGPRVPGGSEGLSLFGLAVVPPPPPRAPAAPDAAALLRGTATEFGSIGGLFAPTASWQLAPPLVEPVGHVAAAAVTAVSAATARASGGLAACFRASPPDALLAQSGWTLTVNARGAVRTVRPSPPELGAGPLSRCLTAALQKLRLGRVPSGGSVRVTLEAWRSGLE